MSKRELMDLIEALAGREAKEVFSYLLEQGKELTDEEISRNTGIRVNAVRKALYSLSELGLISYRRIRDRNTGWYVYYWRINLENIDSILLTRKKEILKKLKERLEYERGNTFFICENEGIRYTFDEAFEYDFRCPRCGGNLVHVDNNEVIEILEKRIKTLEEELKRETKPSSH